jgi:hypothetical protein
MVCSPLSTPPRIFDRTLQRLSYSARLVKVCAQAFPPRPIQLVRLSPHQIVFIAEITARAFIVADSNKRRTLSRADIAKALGKSDQFDFLIDIVPRDEPFVPGVSGPGKSAVKKTIPGSTSVKRDLVSGTCFFARYLR